MLARATSQHASMPTPWGGSTLRLPGEEYSYRDPRRRIVGFLKFGERWNSSLLPLHCALEQRQNSSMIKPQI